MVVLVLISLLLALGVLVALGHLLFGGHTETPIQQPQSGSCATCSGYDPTCEQECMMKAATEPLEYFEDEELDRFRQRPSDSYTDAEVDEFRDVLYTLRPEEVKAWNRSLVLRGIQVPDALKDELFMLVNDN